MYLKYRGYESTGIGSYFRPFSSNMWFALIMSWVIAAVVIVLMEICRGNGVWKKKTGAAVIGCVEQVFTKGIADLYWLQDCSIFSLTGMFLFEIYYYS